MTKQYFHLITGYHITAIKGTYLEYLNSQLPGIEIDTKPEDWQTIGYWFDKCDTYPDFSITDTRLPADHGIIFFTKEQFESNFSE